MSNIDKTASQREVLIQLVEKSRLHQTPGPEDVCIGVLDPDQSQYILWSAHHEGNFCIGENFKAQKTGFLPWKEVEDFLKKYMEGNEEGMGGAGEKKTTTITQKLLTREQLYPSLNTMLSIARNPIVAPQKEPPVQKEMDVKNLEKAIRFIGRGTNDPEIKEEARANTYVILPDGSMVFDHLSVSEKALVLGRNLLASAFLIGAMPLVMASKMSAPKIPLENLPAGQLVNKWVGKIASNRRTEYSDEDKKGILEATFRERAGRAQEFMGISREYALRHVWDDLEKVWDNPALTLEYKKEYLFGRWDETWEKGGGGRKMRQLILDFIVMFLPQDSPQAYASGELEHFRSIQESQSPFNPYN